MKNNTILSALTAVLFVTVLSFGSTAAFVHAQEFDGGDYSGGCCDTGGYSGNSALDGIDYSYAPTYSDSGYSGNSQLDGIDYYSQPTYDNGGYSTGGSTAGGYSTGGYSTGGYSSGGYTTGGYMIGSSYPVYTTPTYHAPATTPSNTTIYAPSNTCTGNSCNRDDHSVVNISNPAPVINNNNVVVGQTQQPVYQPQVCQSGYYGTYPNCYLPQPSYNQPVVYQQPIRTQPYVSLSQVPYTGLDLGFWGSIAYWGFFVAFALFAAYLIAVKRVQNNIARYLKAFLFGSTVEVTEEVATPATVIEVEAPATVVAAETNGDVIDSFIMSQINRTARTA